MGGRSDNWRFAGGRAVGLAQHDPFADRGPVAVLTITAVLAMVIVFVLLAY